MLSKMFTLQSRNSNNRFHRISLSIAALSGSPSGLSGHTTCNSVIAMELQSTPTTASEQSSTEITVSGTIQAKSTKSINTTATATASKSFFLQSDSDCKSSAMPTAQTQTLHDREGTTEKLSLSSSHNRSITVASDCEDSIARLDAFVVLMKISEKIPGVKKSVKPNNPPANMTPYIDMIFHNEEQVCEFYVLVPGVKHLRSLAQIINERNLIPENSVLENELVCGIAARISIKIPLELVKSIFGYFEDNDLSVEEAMLKRLRIFRMAIATSRGLSVQAISEAGKLNDGSSQDFIVFRNASSHTTQELKQFDDLVQHKYFFKDGKNLKLKGAEVRKAVEMVMETILSRDLQPTRPDAPKNESHLGPKTEDSDAQMVQNSNQIVSETEHPKPSVEVQHPAPQLQSATNLVQTVTQSPDGPIIVNNVQAAAESDAAVRHTARNFPRANLFMGRSGDSALHAAAPNVPSSVTVVTRPPTVTGTQGQLARSRAPQVVKVLRQGLPSTTSGTVPFPRQSQGLHVKQPLYYNTATHYRVQGQTVKQTLTVKQTPVSVPALNLLTQSQAQQTSLRTVTQARQTSLSPSISAQTRSLQASGTPMIRAQQTSLSPHLSAQTEPFKVETSGTPMIRRHGVPLPGRQFVTSTPNVAAASSSAALATPVRAGASHIDRQGVTLMAAPGTVGVNTITAAPQFYRGCGVGWPQQSVQYVAAPLRVA